MLILTCLACGLAVWLWLPGPRSLHRRLDGEEPDGHPLAPQDQPSTGDPPPGASRQPVRRLRVALMAGTVAVGAVAGTALIAGPEASVLASAGLIVAGAALLLGRGRRRMRLAAGFRTEVAQACAALAGHLRVGQVPSEALAQAALACPVLGEARRALHLGADPSRVWRQQSARAGGAGLGQLARAWEVAVSTGAPMSATLDQVAAALREDASLRWLVDGELAASRATGAVMAALPACGIGLGYVLGGDPLAWLMGGPAGWACLLTGLLLGCAGIWWIEALARRVWQ